MNINGYSMAIFTHDNEQDYWNALAVVKRLGVDYEDQHDELTIVTEELTDLEYSRVLYATRDTEP